MPVFLLTILISILVLWLIYAQLSFTVTLDYDILKNDGFAAIHFFGISILKIKIKFVSFDIKTKKLTISLNGKIFPLTFEPKGEKDSVFNYLTMPVLSIIDFIYFDIEFEFGYKKDAFLTMLVVQTVRMAAQIFTSIIKSSQELLVDESFLPRYDKDVLKIHFDGIISGSIANIIYSLVHATRLRRDKRKRKDSQLRLKGAKI